MKKIYLSLKSEYFNSIATEKKLFEGRMYKGKYRSICVGDNLLFTNVEDKKDNRMLRVIVKSIHIFPTFEDAFMSIKNTLAVPNHSLNETLKIYYSFYPKKMVKKYGVVFYGIKLVKTYQQKLLIKKA